MTSILFAVWFLHIVATVMPGANTLLVMQMAACGSKSNAKFAALGVAVGSASWATLAVFGVSVVFTTFPLFRVVLQAVGGLYLIYLAVRLWVLGGASTNVNGSSFSASVAFRQGLLTNFTNPKAALFFGSIFSACFPPHPSTALLIGSVVIVFFNAWGWYSLLAHLISLKAIRDAYFRYLAIMGRLAGVILGSLGVRILWASFREAK